MRWSCMPKPSRLLYRHHGFIALNNSHLALFLPLATARVFSRRRLAPISRASLDARAGAEAELVTSAAGAYASQPGARPETQTTPIE